MSKLTLTASSCSSDEEATVIVDRIVVDLAEIEILRCLGEDDSEASAPAAVRNAVQAAVECAYPGTPIVASYDWEANDAQRHSVSVDYDAEDLSNALRCDLSLRVQELQAEICGVVSDAIGTCIQSVLEGIAS